MRVITETEQRTITTPTGVMAGLAAPSQGSSELSTWRVRMGPESQSPVHAIDHEQVWMPVSGALEFTVNGEAVRVAAGEALIVPADLTRQYRTGAAAAEAIVCMPAGGQASTPGSEAKQPVPWAV